MSILGDRATTAQWQCARWFAVTIPAQIFDGSPMVGAARLEFGDPLHRGADRARTDAPGRTGRQRAGSGEGASAAGLSGSGLAGAGAASRLAVGLGLGPAAGGEPKVDVRVAAGVDVRGCLDRPNALDPCRAASVWRGIALGSVLFLSVFRSSFAQASVPKCNLQSATGDSSGSIWTAPAPRPAPVPDAPAHRMRGLVASFWPTAAKSMACSTHAASDAAQGNACASRTAASGLTFRDRNCRPALRQGATGSRILSGCPTRTWDR